MPTVTFGSSEGHGTVTINPGTVPGLSPNVDFLVQVLRPTKQIDYDFDVNMKPTTSYNVLDNTGTIVSSAGDVYTTQTSGNQ